jgi:hypothetical protein
LLVYREFAVYFAYSEGKRSIQFAGSCPADIKSTPNGLL